MRKILRVAKLFVLMWAALAGVGAYVAACLWLAIIIFGEPAAPIVAAGIALSPVILWGAWMETR